MFAVPPSIVDEKSSDSEIQVREGKNVTLRCTGRGHPDPRLMWRREDGTQIVPDDRSPGESRVVSPRESNITSGHLDL